VVEHIETGSAFRRGAVGDGIVLLLFLVLLFLLFILILLFIFPARAAICRRSRCGVRPSIED
jgi:hypothetical protein